MPRQELNVTHPQFLRNAMTTKQGVSSYHYSDNPSLDRSARKAVTNPYSNINMRNETVVESDVNCEEIEADEFLNLAAMQRSGHNISNQNLFDAKPNSASNTTYNSKQGLRHQSLNVNKGAFKSLGVRDLTHSGSMAVTAADRDTNGDSSQNLIRSEMC